VSLDIGLKRGYTVLIVGVIFLVVSAIILVSAIYSVADLAEKMPTNISGRELISSVVNMNQTAVKESLRVVGIDVGLAFFATLVSVTLMVNGIIALIGGVVVLFVDRRRNRKSSRLSPPS
jgi:uncharacterized membrane protein (UPF0182 family)